MKEIKSKVQPNHMECNVWIDLNEDPHGSVKKHWDGINWVKTTNDTVERLQIDLQNLREFVVQLVSQLADLKTMLQSKNSYDDTKIHERINKLNNRVSKLEQFVTNE